MLDRLAVRNLERVGEEWNFSCPFPDHRRGDERPSAYMNHRTTAWICHGCKRKGNAITFVAENQNVSRSTAIKWLRDAYGEAFVPADDVMVELESILQEQELEEEEQFEFLPETTHELFYFNWGRNKDHPAAQYMSNRGFNWMTLQTWDIGVDEEDGRIVLPLRNEFGKLVGYKGRTYWNREPRYKVLGGAGLGFRPAPISKIIYGFPEARKANGQLILCEGELNALKLHQYGYTNAIAISGSYLSEYQANLLVNATHEVTLFFDSDKAGMEGIKRAIALLDPYIFVTVIPEHKGDPASMPFEQVELLLAQQLSAVYATMYW